MSSQYCVIFDMDGVLADTGEIHLKSWQSLAGELDVEFTRQFFEETFGQTSIKILKKLIREDAEAEKLKEWSERKEYYYREMVKDRLEPLPGVKEIIKVLDNNGFKLAVGSSGPRKNVEMLLETLGIKSHFDLIISAEDVENGKPDPEVFLQVANKLDLNTRNCAVIEDAPVGITAARRAGMKTIALTTTHPRKELKDADLIIPDLSVITLDDIFELILTV
jgi:beta-phosphoglucomutase family hydrolase